jgi:hypothetical protein
MLLCKIITYVNPCYLTKCILLESRASIYPYVDKSCGVPFVLTADKLIAGEAQPEPIFGYFLAEDGGSGRK